MPGQKKKRDVLKQLHALGGIDWLCERVSGRATLDTVAAELGCSRWMLDRILHANPEWDGAYREARRVSAGARVDEAFDLIDGADAQNAAAVSKAREQVNLRRWYASVTDRATYGPEQKIHVAGTIAHAHLHELLAHGRPVEAIEGETIADGDVELLEPGHNGDHALPEGEDE